VSGASRRSTNPSDRKVVTADELPAMTPQERRAGFHTSVVRDLSTLPDWYRNKLRARSLETIARRDAEQVTRGSQRASWHRCASGSWRSAPMPLTSNFPMSAAPTASRRGTTSCL
jgi:hypothetical protein